MNTHNRNITGDYNNYYDHIGLGYRSQYNTNNQAGSIYYKGLSAQGPNFLHSTKMNLSTVKLDVNNNAPVLMNSLIERNKEIKNLEKEVKLLSESNTYLNTKIEMLKILASNYGASQEDIEITMSTNDIFCIPKPLSGMNYPFSEPSFENIQINLQEEIDNLSTNEEGIVNFKTEAERTNSASDSKNDSTSDSKASTETTYIKQSSSCVNSPPKSSMNTENEGKKFDLSPKNIPKRSSTLLKATKSLTNSMQAQDNKIFKYLAGTRFGPSISRKNRLQQNTHTSKGQTKIGT